MSVGGAEEVGGQDRPEARHAEQGLGAAVFGDLLVDQPIKVSQFFVQGDDFVGKGGDHQLPDVLCRDFAASIAAWATAADERAPCFISQAWSRACRHKDTRKTSKTNRPALFGPLMPGRLSRGDRHQAGLLWVSSDKGSLCGSVIAGS